MEIHSESSNEGSQSAGIKRFLIMQLLYLLLSYIALAFQIAKSIITWNYTVSYNYFCGNPLLDFWATWFVGSIIIGVFLIPGTFFKINNRNNRIWILFIIAFFLYLLTISFMLIAGTLGGIVPVFFRYIAEAFIYSTSLITIAAMFTFTIIRLISILKISKNK